MDAFRPGRGALALQTQRAVQREVAVAARAADVVRPPNLERPEARLERLREPAVQLLPPAACPAARGRKLGVERLEQGRISLRPAAEQSRADRCLEGAGSGTPPPASSAFSFGSRRPNSASAAASSASVSEAPDPESSSAATSRQRTSPPSRQYCVTAAPLSRTKGGCFAASASVKLRKNAAASGWRNSGSCFLTAMMTSAALPRMRGARLAQVFGNARPDRSMLTRGRPDCNPRIAGQAGRCARAKSSLHQKV